MSDTVKTKSVSFTAKEKFRWDIAISPKLKFFESTRGLSLNKVLELPEVKFNTGIFAKNRGTAWGFLSRKSHKERSLTVFLGYSRIANQTEVVLAESSKIRMVASLHRQRRLIFSATCRNGEKSSDNGRITWSFSVDLWNFGSRTKPDAISIVFTFELWNYQTSPETVSHPLKHTKLPLSSFYESRAFSDVTICCDNEEFKCHRLLLSAISPVFLKIFEYEQQKPNSGSRLVISDIGKQAMKLLIQWVYTCKISLRKEDVKTIMELFKTAHLYCIEPLEKKCLMELRKNISCENAFEMYRLGELYEDDTIQEISKDTILSNKEKILHNSETIQEYYKSYPDVMFDLFHLQ